MVTGEMYDHTEKKEFISAEVKKALEAGEWWAVCADTAVRMFLIETMVKG